MARMGLTAYRRHLESCEHREKGQAYTLCNCPIWVYGKGLRRSLRTNKWERALHRIEILEVGGEIEEGPAGMRLAEAMRRYIADLKSRELASTTVTLYEILFAHLRKFCGEACSLNATDVNMLDRFRQSRTRPGKAGPVPIKPSTQRKEIGFMRAFFGWCVDRDWIPKNPAKSVRMPQEDEDSGTLPFDDAEVARLLAACDQIASDDPAETAYVRKRARALMLTLVYSGLRISDVAKLERISLDAETRHLSIRRIQKTKVWLKVQLHRDAVKALRALPVVNPEYFFWTGKGSLETLRKNMARTIARLGKIAGVKATPHRFRDTFAVELLTNDVDIRKVQQLLGHKSLKTTEKHYAHFVPKHQALLDSATDTLDFSKRKSSGPLLVKKTKRRLGNA